MIVPSAANAGRSLLSASAVVSGRHALVGVEDDRIAAPLRHLDADDLVGEQAVLDRLGGPLVRPGGELVLLARG